ncbi:MAG TPA: SAM domain-containing protein, partial [Roseiarcus sp.]|nr:SAM domain-containing protein [Roseiarcus sp.]
MDIGAWLRGIGLGHYEAAFRDNAIDADLLPDLTDDDLEKLGLPLGHRKRLLKAIANLSTTELPDNTLVAPEPGRAPASRPPKGPQLSAERRPITVMFCDLVGSTA